MDTIDSSIPLQAGRNLPQFGPDYGAVVQMQRTAIAVQQAKQVQQSENALKMIYSNPNLFNKQTMEPTQDAYALLGRLAPETMLDVRNKMAAITNAKLRSQHMESEVTKDLLDRGMQVGKEADDEYMAALAKGIPHPEAQRIGQEKYTKDLDAFRASGIPESVKSQFNPNFDHIRIQRNQMTVAQQLAAQQHERTEARAERGEARADRSEVRADKQDMRAEQSSALAAEKANEPKFVGSVTSDGKRQEMPLRAGGPTGWMDVQGNPVPQGAVSNVRHMGSTATGDPDDPMVQKTAQAIANYQQAPLTGYALRSPGAQAVMAKVLEVNPDYQATRYPEVAKAMRDFGTGKQGDVTRYLNVGIDHLGSLGELASALNNGDISIINRVSNLVKTELNLSTAPNTFEAAKSIVGAEVVKAVVGGAAALGDREEARKPIDSARSPQQLADVIGEYKRLMAGQLGGLERQYEDATGFGPEAPFAFRKKLAPRTIQELTGAKTPNTGKAGEPPAASAAVPPTPGSTSEAAPSEELRNWPVKSAPGQSGKVNYPIAKTDEEAERLIKLLPANAQFYGPDGKIYVKH